MVGLVQCAKARTDNHIRCNAAARERAQHANLNGAEAAAARKDKAVFACATSLGTTHLPNCGIAAPAAIPRSSYGATVMWPFILGWKRQK